jgi:hypothetical protein
MSDVQKTVVEIYSSGDCSGFAPDSLFIAQPEDAGGDTGTATKVIKRIETGDIK